MEVILLAVIVVILLGFTAFVFIETLDYLMEERE